MSLVRPTIIVIAKEPVPGRVKTRLTPAVTAAQAARLAAAALQDTFEVAASIPARRRILALDGKAGDWVPSGWDVVPQVPGGLDRRLAGAFAAVTGPALLIGMDTPHVTAHALEVDFAGEDAWLGPSVDGGFWAVAMADPDPLVFPGVPMSTPSTGQAQLDRLRTGGRSVGLLPMMRDVDTIADARAIADIAPHTRFAMEFDRITSGGAWADEEIYGRALRSGAQLQLRHGGAVTTMPVARWLADPDEADETLLARCTGATLDVGCGPGRFTIALARRGISCLGVDVAEAAVAITLERGGTAVCRSVFAPLPGEGTWDTLLLADGNLGIAGDPDRLLRRARTLLRPRGTLLVEALSSDAEHTGSARLGSASGAASRPFPWARLGAAAAVARAVEAGFTLQESWSSGGRCFLSFRS